MTLYVRRISQRWVGKYDLFHFIQDMHNGYPTFVVDNQEELKKVLLNLHMEKGGPDMLQEHVFVDEDDVYLYIVDKEREYSWVTKVVYNVSIEIPEIM